MMLKLTPLALGLALLLLPRVARGADYEPSWAGIAPLRTISLAPRPGASAEANGAALLKAAAALRPGDRLELAAGTYSVAPLWDLRASGTAEAPVWIVAAKGAQVVVTRPNAKQNVINVGQGGPVQYLCLRGIEFTGGGHGVRLGQCRQVWIDRCHIHHNNGVCLSANSAATSRLYLTRNHIHHGGGHGEGMYLGSHDGRQVMSESVIALNHVHDCRGSQGDGIEVKQGSWGNLIAENHIHDCNYPCLTIYGTGGKAPNIIERNLCYNSADSVIQVQGEAVVRNNVFINGRGAGIASKDHEGRTLNLQIIHNTVINRGPAFRANSWNDRAGLVLANNVFYSQAGEALHFVNGNAGVLIAGNVVLGGRPRPGCTLGHGLEDFADATWVATRREVTPTAGAPFENADAKYLTAVDFYGRSREGRRLSGAIGDRRQP